MRSIKKNIKKYKNKSRIKRNTKNKNNTKKKYRSILKKSKKKVERQLIIALCCPHIKKL